MSYSVRRLVPADAAIYRDIRLEALRTEPDAFGSDFDYEDGLPSESWAERLKGETFGVFDGLTLAGIATLVGEERMKVRHRANIYGVYVRPAARGSNAARLLFDTLIAAAAPRFLQLHLVVAVQNERARRFYERFGFAVYGTDPRGLHVGGRYNDDYLMALRLDEGSRKVKQDE